MPWPEKHKAETRARIVNEAAAALRERGLADVAVAEIMKRAGLTHGGFYGHFRSKDELIADAVAHAGRDSDASLAMLRGGAPPRDMLDEATAYLSPEHLAHPERGCPLAANGPELARGTSAVRMSVAAEIRRRFERLVELCPGRRALARRRRDAAGTLACMVGGMMLARALPDAEGRELLGDVRSFLKDALASQHSVKSP
jgi:TetR/AcrR family transcriptional regulator, transcriptional repressor for nem operon